MSLGVRYYTILGRPYNICTRRLQDVIYNPRGFLADGCRPVSARWHDKIKVSLVQSQDPYVSLISQMTWSCVSIYQQCHGNIEGDITQTSLQYQNVQWAGTFN